jgi:electron transport complex protein RnfD
VLTAIFRLFTTMPEGVSFAIILMNVMTPLLDRLTVPVSFGGDRRD